ncbi:hypothetical protein TSUD_174130 [Trifolium subterraneum]|nr:hypothetical protein TSUD_174130 [Trifolium subterraneum]
MTSRKQQSTANFTALYNAQASAKDDSSLPGMSQVAAARSSPSASRHIALKPHLSSIARTVAIDCV